jgi:FkbM family methyltransferase
MSLVLDYALCWRRFCIDPAYRALLLLKCRFALKPRYTPCRISYNNWHLAFPDAASFLSSFNDIFVDTIYAVPHDDQPRHILDLGANVGLSVLFFRLTIPAATITALEPDPVLFGYLEQNVHGNGFSDVRLIRAAAWECDTELPFRSDGADGGRLLSAGTESMMVRAVETPRLLRESEVDFLKIDIEGAEVCVLSSCRNELHRVRRIFVEFHGADHASQQLAEVLSILSGAGFELHVQSVYPVATPFLGVPVRNGFTLQLNIFGWRL